MRIVNVNVILALEVSDEVEVEAFAADATNEILRGAQRQFLTGSSLIDYRIGEHTEMLLQTAAGVYQEGDAFSDIASEVIFGQPISFSVEKLAAEGVHIYGAERDPSFFGFTGCEADMYPSLGNAVVAALVANPQLREEAVAYQVRYLGDSILERAATDQIARPVSIDEVKQAVIRLTEGSEGALCRARDGFDTNLQMLLAGLGGWNIVEVLKSCYIADRF